MPRITERIRLSKSADAVWPAIGSFDAIGKWHPWLSAVEVHGVGPGTLRTAHLRDGRWQRERLTDDQSARHRYRYTIVATSLPVRDHVAEFLLDDNGDGTSTVRWSAEFEVSEGDEAEAISAIRAFLRAGLENLAAIHGAANRARLVGINHVALEVDDVDAALAFYHRIFDFDLRGRAPGMAFIDMGDQFLALAEGRRQQADDNRHFGLVVDDRSGVRERALAAGATLSDGPGLEILDPWGNHIQVVEYRGVQFSKLVPVLEAMNVASEKSERASSELRAKGILINEKSPEDAA
jgi:catechol 2,3-dioxygenase-like lactoylglutathione lyase family enzyme